MPRLPTNKCPMELLPAIGLYIPARPVRRGLRVPFFARPAECRSDGGSFLGKQKRTEKQNTFAVLNEK